MIPDDEQEQDGNNIISRGSGTTYSKNGGNCSWEGALSQSDDARRFTIMCELVMGCRDEFGEEMRIFMDITTILYNMCRTDRLI